MKKAPFRFFSDNKASKNIYICVIKNPNCTKQKLNARAYYTMVSTRKGQSSHILLLPHGKDNERIHYREIQSDNLQKILFQEDLDKKQEVPAKQTCKVMTLHTNYNHHFFSISV
jgi:hypothetical protein